ncbi:transcription elongation factor Elf1 like-domain-containing protein [Aspergillus germanicus]
MYKASSGHTYRTRSFPSTDCIQAFQGKRKKSSRQPQPTRKREPLPSTFACLFCNHENSIIVKLDKKLGLGHLSCKVCGQRFQTGINYLSAAVDVYSDWVDACDAVAKDAANKYEESDAHGLRSSNRPLSPDDRGVELAEQTGHYDDY